MHLFQEPIHDVDQENKGKRSVFINPVQTHLDHVFICCIRLGNAPSKVDINQAEFSLLAPLTQFREDPFDEVVPLCMHVIESAAHKYADGLPGEGHD